MSDYRKSRLEHAYSNSSEFKMLVDMIQNLISTHGFSPTEIREAALLACVKYELEDPKATDEHFKRIVEFMQNRIIP
jgi:hypothetical protein